MSAFVVLVAHSNQVIVGPSWQGLYLACGLAGQAAVMLFFALSGFLICKSITRNGAAPGGFDLRTYAADRLNRIMPPLLFSLAVVAILWLAAPMLFSSGTREFREHYPFDARSGFDIRLSSFLGTAVFLNGFATGTVSVNGPLWSLSFEVWYYVAAGAIACLRGRGVAVAGVLLLSLGWINHDFILLSVVWFAGAVVALVHNAGMRLTWIARLTAAFSLIATSLLAYTYFVDNALATSTQSLVTNAIPYYNVFIGLFFAAMIHGIVTDNLKVPTFASSSAAYSYTLYILHFPLLLVIYGTLQPHVHRSLAATAVVAGGAAVGCWVIARYTAPWLESKRPLRRTSVRTRPSTDRA